MSNLKDKILLSLIIAGVVIFLFLLIYGGYLLKRQWNYNFGYETKVKETVCEMVKPEYLNKPEDC